MILLAEDDLELADLVRERLEREGFAVQHVARGDHARDMILGGDPPELVILDVMMPGIDGFDVCRAVRDDYAGPILMMTARDDDIDQVLGLELGADDYVVKPVRPRVLIARVRALLRRARAPERRSERIESGDVTIDASRRDVHVRGELADLTTTEFDVLWYLASRAGIAVSREDIYRDVFGTAYDGLDRAVDVYVSRLRQKLADDPRQPRLLKTVRGTGYLFAPHAP